MIGMRSRFEIDLADAEADAALDLADEVDRAADEAEAHRLQVALRWADLHGRLDGPGGADGSPCLPGAERLVALRGAGGPRGGGGARGGAAAGGGVRAGRARRGLADVARRVRRPGRRRPRPPPPPAAAVAPGAR